MSVQISPVAIAPELATSQPADAPARAAARTGAVAYPKLELAMATAVGVWCLLGVLG